MQTINFRENNNVVRNENIERYRIDMAARQQTLSDAELAELITKAQHGSKRARNKVVEANLCFVWSMAAHYNGMDNFEDILQNGNIGLIMAVDTFDVSRGTKFSTWALEMIRKQINIGLTDESRTVRVRADLVRKSDYTSVSVDAPIGNEDGEEKTLLDFMASDFRTDANDDVEAMRVKLNYLMRDLKEIERKVVCGLFGFGCTEETENTLSAKFGLTRERIRQIKWEAIEKMSKLG